MTTLGKAGIAITSISTIGGGLGYGVHLLNYEDPTNLKFKLVAEGFDLNVNETEWATILEAHNKVSKNTFQTGVTTTKDKEWLKSQCRSILNKKDEKNTNYGLAIQWCVKKEKISDILKKKGSKFRQLDTDDSILESETNLWKEKIKELEKSENNNAKTNLNVQLNGPSDNDKVKEVKDKCKTINETETIGADFGNKFKLAKEWCFVAIKQN